MAIPQQPLGPVPNVRLRDNPTEDAIWKRWFEALRNRTTLENQIDHNLLLGLQGGTTDEYYHLTAAQHTAIGSLGTFGNNQVVYTNGSGALTTEAAFGYDQSTNTLTVDNAVLGSSSSNTLTINSGTWTLGSNYVATRAVGTAASGNVVPSQNTITFTGDPGGGTLLRSWRFDLTAQGANAISEARGATFTATNLATNTITTLIGANFAVGTDASGNVTTATAQRSSVNINGSGNIGTGLCYSANAPTLGSTGVFTGTLIGYASQNLGHVTGVNAAVGHDAVNMTVCPTLTVSYRSQQNSGTGAWGYLHTGTANNAFAGNTRFGSTVAPTATVDITGTLAVSTTATIGTVCQPDTNDGAALGTTALQWSDLFLASGAVINFANGNAAITHSSGIITVSTGDLRVTTAGTNAASAVTVGGTQTLSNKTLDTTTISDAANFVLNTSTGTKIGTATNQKLGFWNSAPIAQPSSTGETAGFTAGAGTNVTDESTFTGNVGSTAYRISDIVKHLKNEGLIAA